MQDELQKTIDRIKSTQTNGAITSTISVCPKCKGKGIEWYEKDGLEYARDCDCGIVEQRKLATKLNFADIPKAFEGVRLNNFDSSIYQSDQGKKRIRIVMNTAKYWLDNLEKMKQEGIGLYINSGTKGSGKTRLAVSIANELIYEHRMSVKFATSMKIINEIKATWESDSEYTESELLNQLSRAQVLIIDDFGTEQAKPWINEKFYSVINERYINKKLTIFTSNYALPDLQCDERITNRIEEMTLPVVFPEESVRVLIANKNKRDMIDAIRQM